MDNEPITAKKFFTGAVQPKTGIKALAFIPWLLLFTAIGFCVWFTINTILKPKPTQNQVIVAKPGSTINVQQKQEAPKRFLIPFLEIGVEQSSNRKFASYIRGGLRIEW